MDPYAAYAQRATSPAVPRLVGVMRTRTEAKARYTEIVAQIFAAQSTRALERLLASIEPELIQFRSELPFLWEGDGDFAGLQQEIERAFVRLDAGLDHPRHEVN